MRMSRGWNGSHLVAITILLSAATSAAHADPITSDGYTITDLGPGIPTIGNGLVIAPNGQVAYSFPQTPNTVLTPGMGIAANIPQLPDAYNGYSTFTSAIMNSNGVVAATGQVAGNGHQWGEVVYAIQRNADSSWGQPNYVFGVGALAQGSSNVFSVVGLSKSNEILINVSNSPTSLANSLVYDANTNTTIDLTKALSGVNGFQYTDVQSLAIDDMGRIVLSAGIFTLSSSGPSFQQTSLLLTPDGVSSDPIEMTVPEPSTLAFILLTVAGYAVSRSRRSRRVKGE